MTQEIIKFLTAGNVDDGKSTLIGRLLHDTNSLYQDQIDEVKHSTDSDFDGELDFSLFLDGLTSERAQKITIDVAYRYFSYQKQKLIIADAPGHEQYTRNMAVAAANSDAVIILIDATKGVQDQTVRHSYIAHLFGIKNVIVAVNKMDLVHFNEVTFNQIRYNFLKKTSQLTFDNIHFVPISALSGANIVKKSASSWYFGESIIDYLLQIKQPETSYKPLRLQIQNILKHENKRHYQGLISSGKIKTGTEITSYPSNQKALITNIIHSSKDVTQAEEGSSITITLDKEIDLDRGGLIATPDQQPYFSNSFDSHLIWFSDKEFRNDSSFEILVKINHNYLRAKISKIHHIVSINHTSQYKNDSISLNQIANVELKLAQETAFDLFENNKNTGSFLLIDKNNNETLACGVITNSLRQGNNKKKNPESFVTKMLNLTKKFQL